jgi:hypothetical protein
MSDTPDEASEHWVVVNAGFESVYEQVSDDPGLKAASSKDQAYYDELQDEVLRPGTRSGLLGTSARALRVGVGKLRKARGDEPGAQRGSGSAGAPAAPVSYGVMNSSRPATSVPRPLRRGPVVFSDDEPEQQQVQGQPKPGVPPRGD